MAAFSRVYRSFAEFEREELRGMDARQAGVDEMLEEKFNEELDFEEVSGPHRRGGPPSLFD